MSTDKSQLQSESSASETEAPKAPLRAGLYVDGFNLYHAIADLGDKHLRWLNLWALGELIIPSKTEVLSRVVYCSAYYPGDSNRKWRHQMYLKALAAAGVTCELGHFVAEPVKCGSCKAESSKFTEKEGDLNVALNLINDAHCGLIDHAYLLTADSDQAATARMFRSQFKDKKFTMVSPPGRNFSADIGKYATGRHAIGRTHLERCLFGPRVISPDGKHGHRPREWAPPGEV